MKSFHTNFSLVYTLTMPPTCSLNLESISLLNDLHKKEKKIIVLFSGIWITFTLFDLECWVSSSKILQQLLSLIFKAVLTVVLVS